MSESSSAQTQQTSQQDNRVVVGPGAINAQNGSSVTLNTLDAAVANNAVDASTQDLKTALNFSSGNVRDVFAFASKSQDRALDSLNVEANLVKNAYADAKGRGALTDKIIIGAVVMAGLVAIAAVRKK